MNILPKFVNFLSDDNEMILQVTTTKVVHLNATIN